MNSGRSYIIMGSRSWLLRWPIAISLFIIIALLPDDAQRGRIVPSKTLGQMVSINDSFTMIMCAGWSGGGGGGGVRIVEAKMKKVRKKKQGKPLIRPQAMFVLKWLFICPLLAARALLCVQPRARSHHSAYHCGAGTTLTGALFRLLGQRNGKTR